MGCLTVAFSRRLSRLLVLPGLLACIGCQLPNLTPQPPYDEARAPIDQFFAAFNEQDIEGIRETLHYPHVRIASMTVAIAQKPEDYSIPFDRLIEAEGWDHSTLDSCELRQSSGSKAHFELIFSRYDATGEPYTTHKSLWIVVKKGGIWGIQARSSFAP